jgi:hypothetical protein
MKANMTEMGSWKHGALLATVSAIVATSWVYAQDANVPGGSPAHKLLQLDEGEWDAEMSLFLQPGAPPLVSQCSETNELLPGGLWVISRFEGNIAGAPFSGVGMNGYDPVKKKYVGSWVDSMTPHMMTYEGDYDEASKTLTTAAQGRDPQSGEVVVYKQIARHVNENTRTFEMHAPGADGEYEKMMEIKYTRRTE